MVVASTRQEAPGEALEDPLADLEHLYRAYGDRLLRHCRRHLRSHGDAEDAAHEALLKAWAARERFDRARPVWPWLATIARNTCIDQLRRQAAHPLGPWHEAAPLTPEDVVTAGAADGRAIRSALADLPRLASEALLLRDVEGLGYDEIAARQARSAGAVRNAVARARKELRASLAGLPSRLAGFPLLVVAALRRRWARGRAALAEHGARLGAAVESAAAPLAGSLPAAGQLLLVATLAVGTGAAVGAATQPERPAGRTFEVAPPGSQVARDAAAGVEGREGARPDRSPGGSAAAAAPALEPATPGLPPVGAPEAADLVLDLPSASSVAGDDPLEGLVAVPGPAPAAPAVEDQDAVATEPGSVAAPALVAAAPATPSTSP